MVINAETTINIVLMTILLFLKLDLGLGLVTLVT
jgi:hypothetical protein